MINSSEIVKGKEKCQYDFENDIGGRFGSERKEIVLDYLDAASRLMVELVRRRDEYQEHEKVIAALHLSANVFDFQCSVACRIGNRIFQCEI